MENDISGIGGDNVDDDNLAKSNFIEGIEQIV
jgi:hypothetical protein